MAEAVPVVRLAPGAVVTVDGQLAVTTDGATLPATWAGGYCPAPGDAVMVLVVDGTAWVLGPSAGAGARPLTGTVSGAASSGTVPVSTTAGTLAARYGGSAPGIGTLVRLDWAATTPWIITAGAATVPAPDPEPPPPPRPPVQQTGTLDVPATDSATWSSRGVWDGYYRSSVVQGSYSGRTYSGAFFYGDAPRQVAGRTIRAARIRLGARLRIGSYNAPLTVNLWLHGARVRPSGDVPRISGPHTVVLGPGAGAGWVEIPAGWGQYVVDNGGGFGVFGGSYGGVEGIAVDPAAGQVQLDWSR